MKPNNERIAELTKRLATRRPKYALGQMVQKRGLVGAIDSVYADYDALCNTLQVPRTWYEMQTDPPRTPKSGYWYGVILTGAGAVVWGEDDIEVSS